ncbi:MAG TPA: DUF1329 domain-containing protein [Candidatus Binatia bacterium]
METVRRTWTFWLAFLILTTAPAYGAVQPGASPKALLEIPEGTILSKDNWEIAQGFLPDEILELYKRGDYANPIRHLEGKKGTVADPRLVEISQKNAGRFDVDDKGTVVDKSTGTRPPVIIGWPFPQIDPNDPKAGAKVLWNYLYTLHWAGSFHTTSPLNWVTRDDGIQRRISVDVHFKYYDGQPPEIQERIGPNPLNILNRTMGVATEPADVNGIVSLNWRYREGDKQDQAWTYVPALRRVRPINPANRADGFLGSDLSQDDGPYFDGKPEEFETKLVGEGWILGTFDDRGLTEPLTPIKLTPDTRISPLIDGSEMGWRLSYPKTNLIAAQEEGWQPGSGLVAWAPRQIALVPRPVWIVEAVPKNPYYLYGKQVMYFDKENFRGYWKGKYDWKGQVLMNYQVPESLIQKIDGPPGYMRISYSGGVAIINNIKQDRATVSGLPVADTDVWLDIPDEIFETERVVRYGK